MNSQASYGEYYHLKGLSYLFIFDHFKAWFWISGLAYIVCRERTHFSAFSLQAEMEVMPENLEMKHNFK